MEFQSFNSELGTSNLLFKRLFSNIRIGRTNKNGEETQITVPCVFGQRSRILKNLENPEKRGNMKVPMIVINRTGYSRNGDRLNNLNNEVKYEISSIDRRYQLMAPVPVDITYDVSIIAKYPSDIDKIASNFMVFFNSDIYVSCQHPKYEGIKMNNQVIMSDSVSEEHSDEIDGTQDDLITSTFNFTFKTFLFGGTRQAKLVPQKILSSYTSSFISADIVQIDADKIDQFQKDHPNQCVSAILTNWVTADITSYVDNPNASVDIYDDIPIINKIDFGFYVVPQKYEIEPYIQSVDNGAFGSHDHNSLCGYISSEAYINSSPTIVSDPYLPDAIIAGEPLSTCQTSSFNKPLQTCGDYYDNVDWECSLAPYVDKLYWKIEAGNKYEFPNNVSWERG